VLELKAREKACEYLDKACHGESCPLAKGFYDRLPLARRAILKSQMLMSYEHLRAIAIEHQVCPYYLSQDLARWSDVIVGDYNYYFDNSALLFALKSQNQWSVSVLVDEAHNLLERARGMYTASLDSVALGVLRKKGPAVLKKSLDKVNRCWKALSADQELTYQTYLQVPDKLLFALQQAVSAIADFFNDALAIPDVMLQRFYFDAIQFMRLAESFSNHSLFEIHKQAPHSVPQRAIRNNSTLTIRNVLPAPFLEPRFKAAVSTVLFSATIGPARFLKDTLGLDAATPWVNVRSPFAAEQLSVHLVNDISTRYKDRDRSLSPIAELMAWQYRKQPGNYLAFFSSFDYLEKAVALFSARFPNIPLWAQTRQMSEADRTLFIDRFTESSCGIGFAVLGGSFGEGIDLPGQRLIGAFIATLGLPQLNPVNEQIKLRLDLLFGAGYDYTYFYPGIQKVVQAAGRVIRTTTDRGVLYLIDDRFAQPNVRHLLPEWWSVRSFNWQTQLNHLSLAD
jgi:Rad3-related DNA helicase